jgi:hypothetical protein
MSVTLKEVIEAGGYDLTTLEDAQWLLAQKSNFDELTEEAEETIERLEEEAEGYDGQ